MTSFRCSGVWLCLCAACVSNACLTACTAVGNSSGVLLSGGGPRDGGPRGGGLSGGGRDPDSGGGFGGAPADANTISFDRAVGDGFDVSFGSGGVAGGGTGLLTPLGTIWCPTAVWSRCSRPGWRSAERLACRLCLKIQNPVSLVSCASRAARANFSRDVGGPLAGGVDVMMTSDPRTVVHLACSPLLHYAFRVAKLRGCRT
jgi:hypothetical protein